MKITSRSPDTTIIMQQIDILSALIEKQDEITATQAERIYGLEMSLSKMEHTVQGLLLSTGTISLDQLIAGSIQP